MKFTLTETDINGNPINTTEIDLDVTEKRWRNIITYFVNVIILKNIQI